MDRHYVSYQNQIKIFLSLVSAPILMKHPREKTSDSRCQDGTIVETNETHNETRPTKFIALLGRFLPQL